jgi:AraC-like DNA-binding protein
MLGRVPRSLAIPGTISTLQLQPLVLVLGKLGLDAERIFGPLGLSLDRIADSSARVAAGVELDVWDAIEAATGNPAIGVRIADEVEAGALGAYEYLLRNSVTLRAAIEAANRYERVVDDLTRVALIEAGSVARLRLWRVGDYPHPAQGIECTFSVIVRLVRVAVPVSEAHGGSVHEVCFPHRLSGSLEERTRRFGCPVKFDQPYAEIVFPSALLDMKNMLADPRLGQVLEEQVGHMLATLPTEDPLIHRARVMLAALLAAGNASLETLADELHMSARTLRRRLEQQGTSYKALLDELRKQLACHYIAQTDQSLEQIAARLGFTEASTFYRAFKRWHGTTPAVYRASHAR